MRNSLTCVVLAVVSSVGWLSFPQDASPLRMLDLVQQQGSATQPLSDASHQSECTKQAREEFHRDGWDSESNTHFIQHYNERLKRCFVEIEFSGPNGQGGLSINKSLGDAQGRDFADYVATVDAGQEPSSTPPLCEITLSSGERMDCHSEAEFDAIVADYMK
jgi:hypothetical protein